MTDPTDDLIQQLAAANPVDRQSIPAADEPAAQSLLENIMNQSSPDHVPHGPPTAPAPLEAQSVDGQTYDDVRDGVRAQPITKRSLLRGRGMLVGAAAAVLLLVGGLLVFSPDSTPSAVATVHSAAAAAADADTGRISTTFALNGEKDGEAEQFEGRFDAAYAGSNVMFSVQIDQQPGDFALGELPFTDARLVDDVLYVDTGGQWLAVDTEGFLGDMVVQFIDPRVVLETVQELTDATEVGSATINGVETTHYQSVVDLGDETLAQSGWMAFEGVSIEAEGEVTVDLYVGADGVLSQLDLSGDVQDAADSGDSGTFNVSMGFSDIGSDITVEAPADALVVSPLEGLLQED